MEAAQLSSKDIQALDKLKFIAGPSFKFKKQKPQKGEQPYELSRYIPTIKNITKSFFQGQLSTEEFPFVNEEENNSMPFKKSGKASQNSIPTGSLKKSQPKWQSSGTTGNFASSSTNTASKNDNMRFDESRPMLYVFVAGGATFSELRSAYEVPNCILGATHFITPTDYVNDLSLL